MLRQRQRHGIVLLVILAMLASPFSRVFCAVVTGVAAGSQNAVLQTADSSDHRSSHHHDAHGADHQAHGMAHHASAHGDDLARAKPEHCAPGQTAPADHSKHPGKDCAVCLALAAAVGSAAIFQIAAVTPRVPDAPAIPVTSPISRPLTGTLGSRGPPILA